MLAQSALLWRYPHAWWSEVTSGCDSGAVERRLHPLAYLAQAGVRSVEPHHLWMRKSTIVAPVQQHHQPALPPPQPTFDVRRVILRQRSAVGASLVHDDMGLQVLRTSIGAGAMRQILLAPDQLL